MGYEPVWHSDINDFYSGKKSVKRIHWSTDNVVIVFTDNTYCHFILYDRSCIIESYPISDDVAFNAGLIEEKEYKLIQEKRQKELEQKRKDREFAMYQELKAKFENNDHSN